jgi:regulator of sigma E protease
MAHAQDIVTNLFGFILVLGFLIFAHESGHFMMAKLFRVRVLVFSFGFGKRLFGFHKGDTDYRVSLIPLGGYVRMAGDTPEENVAGKPDEFLSKPKWQRFVILFAGPFMNVLIAVTFVAALAMVGIEDVATKPIVKSVEAKSPAARAGLQAGDRITRIKGEPVEDFTDLRVLISMNAGTPLQVVYVRSGVSRATTLTPARENGEYGPIGRAGIAAGNDPIVGRVVPESPAAVAGIRGGDRIVSAGGQAVTALEDYVVISDKAAKAPLPVEIARGNQRLRLTIAPIADENLAVSRGIVPQTRVVKLTLFPAIRYSVAQNWKMLRLAGSSLGRLFRPEGSVKELSGPVSIARIAGEMLRRSLFDVISLMALISLQLGIMNLLPIPVLDGGHIMIILIEGIARRDLSLRVKERIQQVGFAALATLMIVVLYNDVISNVLRVKNG